MSKQTLENPVIQVSGTATIEPAVEVANLVSVEGSQVVTTSLKIAEVFCKNHKDVLRAIRELDCSQEFNERNFALIQKISDLGQGRSRKDPMYQITRDGFVFLVMGFTGKTAARFKEAYIRAFNEMEERLRREQQAERRLSRKPAHTMADLPGIVGESLRQAEQVVEMYDGQRVVSSVTLARLMGKEHRYVCDSIRRMFKHTLRPSRLFIRRARTVRKGYGEGYDGEGVVYYVTIEGFNTMRTHAKGLSDEVAERVMAAFRTAKGRCRAPKAEAPKAAAPQQPPRPGKTERRRSAPKAAGMPQSPADMMQRFVKAMAVMMGVDVNGVSDLMDGGSK